MEEVLEQDGDKTDTKATTAKGEANTKKRPVEKQEGAQKVRSEVGEPPIALPRIDLAPSPFGTTQSKPREFWLPVAATPHKATSLCSCNFCQSLRGAKPTLPAGGPLSTNAGHSGSSSSTFWPSVVERSMDVSPPGLPNPPATQGTFGSRFSSAGQLGATGIRFNAGRPTLVFPTGRPTFVPLFGSAPKPANLPATDGFKFGPGPLSTTGLFGFGVPLPDMSTSTPFGPPSSSVLGAHQPFSDLSPKSAAPENTKLSLSEHLQLAASRFPKTLGPIPGEGLMNAALPMAPINNDYLAYAQAEYAKMEGNADILEATAERIGANWLRLDDATRRMYEISVVLIEPQGPAWAAAMKQGLLLAIGKLKTGSPSTSLGDKNEESLSW